MFSWPKKRDPAVYPDDAIGTSLYNHCPDPAQLPEKVVLWYEVYFDSEADAEAVAKLIEERRIEVSREHDEEPDEGLGAWAIDFEMPIRARHIDLKTADAEITRLIADHRGKIGSCLLMPFDEAQGK